MFQRRSKGLGFDFLRSVFHERNDAVRLGPQFLIGCRTDQWCQLHSYGWESNFMFGAHSYLCGGLIATGGNPSTVWVPLRMFSPGLKPVGAPSLKPGGQTDKIVLSPCTQGSPNQELVPVRIARSVCMHARGTQNPAGVPGGRRNDALSHAPASGGKLGAATYKRACLCARTSKAAGSIAWLHCRASRKASRRHRVNP